MKKIISILLVGFVLLSSLSSTSAENSHIVYPEEYNGQPLEMFKQGPEVYNGQELIMFKQGPEEYNGQPLEMFNGK